MANVEKLVKIRCGTYIPENDTRHSAMKKNKLLVYATWMNPKDIMLP